MSQIVLTLKQNGFRSRLQGYIVKENLLPGIADVRDLPERLEMVTSIARRMPGGLPEDTDQKTLEIICSAVIATLCDSPVLAAVVNAREVEREKNRAAAAAKRRGKEGELMGTVDIEQQEEERRESAKQGTVPLETTRTALAGVPNGVHFLPDNRGEARNPIELEIAKVPIDASGLYAPPADGSHEVTPWQEPDLEPLAPLSPGGVPTADTKEGTHGDKNPTLPPGADQSDAQMSSAIPASGPSTRAVHDPFESAFAEEACARGLEVEPMEGVQPTPAPGSQEVAAAADAPSEYNVDAVASDAAPAPVVDHSMEDIEEVDAPAGVTSEAVAAEVKEVEAALERAASTVAPDAGGVDDRAVIPATPPQPDAGAEEARDQSRPQVKDVRAERNEGGAPQAEGREGAVASDENESASEVLENQEPHDMLAIAAQLAFHLREDVLSDPYVADGTTRAKLKLISRAVETALLRIEDSEDNDNRLHYDLDPPISNWFLDKANCAWLVVMLNYIEVVTNRDVQEALDDIETHGYPARLLGAVNAKSPKAQKRYYLGIADKASNYLKNVSVKKSLGQAIARDGVFPSPSCVMDLVPSAWVERYFDEAKRDFYDINAKRRAGGLAEYASVAEMRAAPDFEAQRDAVDKERDEEDDDSFDEEDENELEEDDFEDGDADVDLEANDGAKKRKGIDKAAPRARNPNPAASSRGGHTEDNHDEKAAAAPEKKSGGDRRKGSAPKRNAGAAKREASPLPEMRPKLKFVAEAVCERYDEVRTMAQDPTPKRRDTLTREADDADEGPSADGENGGHAPEKAPKPKKQRTKPSPCTSSVEKTDDERALETKLQQVKQLMPIKLQAGLTIERIGEGIEAVLAGREVPNASAKRAIHDGAQLAHHQLARTSSAVIDIDLRKRLTRILNSPSMTCSAPSAGRFYRTVCSLTSALLERSEDVAYLKADASEPDHEGVRIDAKLSAHFIAINFMLRVCTCSAQHASCARAPVGGEPGTDAAFFLFAYCYLLKAASGSK